MSIECTKSECPKHNKVEPFCDELMCIETLDSNIIDQVCTQYPNLLMEEVLNVVERMMMYQEPAPKAIIALKSSGVLL